MIRISYIFYHCHSQWAIQATSARGCNCCTTRICGGAPLVGPLGFLAMGFIMPMVGSAPKTSPSMGNPLGKIPRSNQL